MSDILLIGAARSGTKWVRGVLASSHQIREIPFDVNFMWRTGQHDFPHDSLQASSCSPKLAEKITGKLHKSAAVRTGDIFLEKTVSNTLRVPFVHRVFPDGKFIHLIRDGRDVIESAYRLWREEPDFSYLLTKLRHFPLDDWRYGVWFVRNTFFKRADQVSIWGPRYEGIEDDVREQGVFAACCHQWVKSVELASQGLEAIPDQQKFSVRYEDLISNSDTVNDLLNYLQLTYEDTDRVLEYYQSSVQSGLGGKWKDRLTEQQIQTMTDIAGPLLNQLGYTQ